jgi:hypothetical protein
MATAVTISCVSLLLGMLTGVVALARTRAVRREDVEQSAR